MNTISNSGTWWRTAPPTALLVLAAGLVLPRPASPAPSQAGCDTLLAQAAKANEIPQITIDAKTESVHVRTSRGECVESLSAAKARPAPTAPPAAPPAATAPEPAPAAPAPEPPEPRKPPETHPYFRTPPPAPPAPRAKTETPKPEGAPAAAPAPDGACVKNLGGLWKQGEHDIGGSTYWLSEVFTIDLDNNGRTDNVGFRLKAPGKPDLVIRYFAKGGQTAARSVATLRLDDEDVVSRLCFGRASFAAPPPKKRRKAPAPAFEAPDLAKEMMARQAAGDRAKGKAAGEPKGAAALPVWLWAVIVGGAILVLAAVGVGAYLTRHRWLPARNGGAGAAKEEEEAGEDGENKENETKGEAKKQGKGGADDDGAGSGDE